MDLNRMAQGAYLRSKLAISISVLLRQTLPPALPGRTSTRLHFVFLLFQSLSQYYYLCPDPLAVFGLYLCQNPHFIFLPSLLLAD